MVGAPQEEKAVAGKEKEGSGKRGQEIGATAEGGKKAKRRREITIKEETDDDNGDGGAGGDADGGFERRERPIDDERFDNERPRSGRKSDDGYE